MKQIVLVGFMGSGKSAVGRRVAERLNLPFHDTDTWIEARAGRTVRDLFGACGEPFFRDLESDVIDEIAAGAAAVVSTGGGALLRPRNVEALRRNGVLIHLRVDAPTVLARTGNRMSRPLLSEAADPLARIEELMNQREPVYRQADAVVETVARGVEDIAADVIREWERHGGC